MILINGMSRPATRKTTDDRMCQGETNENKERGYGICATSMYINFNNRATSSIQTFHLEATFDE
jgi:hypothetical protein